MKDRARAMHFYDHHRSHGALGWSTNTETLNRLLGDDVPGFHISVVSETSVVFVVPDASVVAAVPEARVVSRRAVVVAAGNKGHGGAERDGETD